MPDRVKPRSYDSPLRRRQAAATRETILDAAQRRFEQDGYQAASMPTIAAEASVSPKTVHMAFQTKAGLLRAVWEARLAVDEATVPVFERRWFRDLVADPSAEGKLRRLAHQGRQVKGRSGDLMEVIRNAAAMDSHIAELWEDIESKLLNVQRAVIGQLETVGALRRDLSVELASDVLWTLNHPSVWHLLVRGRGWMPEQYEQWVGDTFCAELLEDWQRDRGRPAPGGGRHGR
jgi:AcrR family transcriptional regulator